MRIDASALNQHTRLVRALTDPARYPHPTQGSVTVVETHISSVLLTGDYAYKLKKPVDLGFLDFTSLSQRAHFCHEELRINRRTAEALYVDVVAITGSHDAPQVEADPSAPGAIDYAVRMRQFDQGDRLDACLAERGLALATIESLAERIAALHTAAAVVPDAADWGQPEAVLQPMLVNFDTLDESLDLEALGLAKTCQGLRQWTRARHAQLREVLAGRRRAGRIREGHGDLHTGNIALIDGVPVLFDAIEFAPALRHVDAVNDMAFLAMDLEARGFPGAARRLVSHWREVTDDHQGLALLDLYRTYRALVRAKITALAYREAPGDAGDGHDPRLETVRGYIELAQRYTQPRRAFLAITRGLSGAGKSTLANLVVARHGAIRLRSDVERKRLHGLDPTSRPGAAVGEGLYSEAATQRTFARLREIAGDLLQAGLSVVVDATFLSRARRAPFAALADEHGVDFWILDLDAPVAALEARIQARAAGGGDPSDATLDVLRSQLAAREPLTDREAGAAIAVDATDVQRAPLSRLARISG